MASPSRRRRRRAARAPPARRRDGAGSRRWRGCRLPGSSVGRGVCATSAQRRFVEPRADQPLRRARETRAASAPPPPRPKPRACSGRRRRARPARAAATIAKSPWRRLTSVKAEPVLRSRQTGHWISARHSSGVDRRRHRADEESRRPAACACRICERSTSRASSTCAASGSSADGSACARLPPTVPRLRVCTWPTHASACRSSGTRAASASSRCDVALARARADAHGVGFERDEFQRGDLVDVDQPGRAQQAHRHHRHQALPAGDELGVVAVLRQQLAGLVDRGGADVFKGGRFQRCDLKTLPARYRKGLHGPYPTVGKSHVPLVGRNAGCSISPRRERASGRNYATILDVGCRACGVHRTRRGAGAIVAQQAGDRHRAVHRRQRHRHHGADGGAAAVGAARSAVRGREPARRGRHDRGRRRRPGRAGRPHHPGAFVVLHDHADDLSQHALRHGSRSGRHHAAGAPAQRAGDLARQGHSRPCRTW